MTVTSASVFRRNDAGHLGDDGTFQGVVRTIVRLLALGHDQDDRPRRQQLGQTHRHGALGTSAASPQ